MLSIDRQAQQIRARDRMIQTLTYVCVAMAAAIFALSIVVYQTLGG